jgi:hypothetical protein
MFINFSNMRGDETLGGVSKISYYVQPTQTDEDGGYITFIQDVNKQGWVEWKGNKIKLSDILQYIEENGEMD